MSDKIDAVIDSMGWDLDQQEFADMRRLCEAALSQQPATETPSNHFIPDLPEQMARDLARFNETCEDGQEYDIPKAHMRAMASFGLVRWCGGSRFEITDCGIAALTAIAAAPAAPVAQEPVAWQVRNGVVTHGFYRSKKEADEVSFGMQKSHCLSGSLAAFNVRPLYTDPPAAEQPVCVSGQAKSETQANLSAIRETQAAEQPDMVKVPRDLLADMCSLDHDTRIQAERRLLALLAGGEA